MEKNMFCFQCEQTAGCNGCTGSRGVCGKTADVAKAQDELTGALIGLAKVCGNNPKTADTDRLIIEGLFTTLTNVSFNEETIRVMIERVEEEKNRIAPGCGTCVAKCGNTDNYDMEQIWNADEDIRSLKSLLLFGIRGVAAYAYHAMVLGYQSEEVNFFLYKALATLSMDLGMEELLPVVLETGKVNLTCMELLNRANTETYGIPKPTEVSMKVEKGPFIVVTGHDLRDLKLLLEQTEGKGIFSGKVAGFLDPLGEIFQIFRCGAKLCKTLRHIVKQLLLDLFGLIGKKTAVFQLSGRDGFVDLAFEIVRFRLNMRLNLPFFGLFMFLENLIQGFLMLCLHLLCLLHGTVDGGCIKML